MIGNYFNEKCYKVYTERLTWREAKKSCEGKGGQLTSILDKKTNDYLSSLTSSLVWIGGKKQFDGGIWTDGSSSWDFSNWYAYDNSMGFMVLNYMKQGKWYSSPYHKTDKLPYICQFKSKDNYYVDIFEKLKQFSKISSMIESNQTFLAKNETKLNVVCNYLDVFWRRFLEIKDGPTLSLSKIQLSSLFQDNIMNNLYNFLNESVGFNISFCELEPAYEFVIKEGFQEIRKFIEIKEYDDGLKHWRWKNNYDTCVHVSTPTYGSRVCKCECEKREKLAVYSLFHSLKLMNSFSIKRFGDLFSWYYGDHFMRSPEDIDRAPKASLQVIEEMLSLDRNVLREIR